MRGILRRCKKNDPNEAESEVSIIPRVRVAVPVGDGVKLEDQLRGTLRLKGLVRGEIGDSAG